MSLKKTDMVKNLAKKLDGKMKSAGIPNRFAQGSTALATKPKPAKADAETRLVQVSCRLPAELVNRLRERALQVDGGVNTILAQALQQWLETGPAR